MKAKCILAVINMQTVLQPAKVRQDRGKEWAQSLQAPQKHSQLRNWAHGQDSSIASQHLGTGEVQ